MISITEKAANKINALKTEDNFDDSHILRIKVKQGGCSGLYYKLDFDKEISDKDKTFESNGAKVVIDSQSLLYILGMTLDYDGGLNGAGFTFTNPNATKTCGCGSSFSV